MGVVAVLMIIGMIYKFHRKQKKEKVKKPFYWQQNSNDNQPAMWCTPPQAQLNPMNIVGPSWPGNPNRMTTTAM